MEELVLLVSPLDDRISFEKVEEKEQKTSSGIFLGTNPNDNIQLGRAIEIGRGRIINGVILPLQIQVGDVFRYNKNAVISWKEDGKDVFTVKEADIIAKVSYIEKGKRIEKRKVKIESPN